MGSSSNLKCFDICVKSLNYPSRAGAAQSRCSLHRNSAKINNYNNAFYLLPPPVPAPFHNNPASLSLTMLRFTFYTGWGWFLELLGVMIGHQAPCSDTKQSIMGLQMLHQWPITIHTRLVPLPQEWPPRMEIFILPSLVWMNVLLKYFLSNSDIWLSWSPSNCVKTLMRLFKVPCLLKSSKISPTFCVCLV